MFFRANSSLAYFQIFIKSESCSILVFHVGHRKLQQMEIRIFFPFLFGWIFSGPIFENFGNILNLKRFTLTNDH